jgi:hypothetical protein
LTRAELAEALGGPVAEAASGCWVWRGRCSANGYGVARAGGYAHRQAHELTVGPIPEGRVVVHRCGVRSCVKPEHLVALTRAELGASRMARQVVCARGHSLNPGSPALAFKRDGSRRCRACDTLNARSRRARRRERA